MVNIADVIGFTGVAFLLIAYFLNASNFIVAKSLLYISLNIVGATLACVGSILINYIPFVILETTWCLVSILTLFKFIFNKLKDKSKEDS